MQVKFPMEVEWSGMGAWHDYTFTESATKGRIDVRWHPKATDEDANIAADTGTFFPEELTLLDVDNLINKGFARVKK